MPIELISSISQYGYLAILVLVFLQEVGFPNPIPNELVLLFSGYLAFMGVLSFPLIILSAVIGDLLGSFILYTVFYFFGQIILQRKPKWIPISEKKINSIRLKIEKSGQSGIYIGRLSPFIRGYVSVLSGLLQISPKKYSLILISTSVIWAFSYVTVGFFIGPYWNMITKSDSHLDIYLGLISLAMIILIVMFFLVKRLFVRTN